MTELQQEPANGHLDISFDRSKNSPRIASSRLQFTLDSSGCIVHANDSHHIYLGYSTLDLIGRSIFSLVHLCDQAELHSLLIESFQRSHPLPDRTFSLIHREGFSVSAAVTVLGSENLLHLNCQLLTKLAPVQPAIRSFQYNALETLQRQRDREHLISAIAQRIRESLDLSTIMKRTVEEVRQFLQTDRVLIYRFEPDWSGTIVVESVDSPWSPILGSNFQDPCFTANHIQQYRDGRIQVVSDIHNAGLQPCHLDLLASLQVRANLVVPIVSETNLWGLMIAQHCRGSRQWESETVDLLKQLATQVGVAVQHAELLNRVQQMNTLLEIQVKERTRKLQQILKFEQLTRRITEKVRDSLDESQILQAVTQELAQVLSLDRAKVELYDNDHLTATIAYEYTTDYPVSQGSIRSIQDFSELYTPLLQKESIQFVEPIASWNPNLSDLTRLACPIFDDQGILGNLWLLRPRDQWFDQDEIDCVQQIANQCAIAIRQARLYQTSQAQVAELEKLIQLREQFLMSITHELRTPISSISLATQTLQKVLQLKGCLTSDNPTIVRTIEILERECQREIRLIDNLLTLSYLDAGEVFHPIQINLNVWLPRAVLPFSDRAVTRQQIFITDIADDLPMLETDLNYLERILNELLNNAYKYTPAEGTIVVSASSHQNQLEICVSNSGVEISGSDLVHIFEKFYRVPASDIWECSGAGLGLAVVQKLADQLGAKIEVESNSDRTAFYLMFELISRNV